jgi:DNA polymerase III sliding clamp (beta) subunit (PCNA family)
VLTLEAGSVSDALAQVVVAASADEARPVLAGCICIPRRTTCMWWPPIRTGWRRSGWSWMGDEPKPFSAIVPARTMQELVRLLGECEW